MVNVKKDIEKRNIRELIADGLINEGKKECFKFINKYTQDVTDVYFGLYNLAYCYDVLEEYENAKFYTDKLYNYMKDYKNKYPVDYSSTINLRIFIYRKDLSNEETLNMYEDLITRINEHEHRELYLNTKSSIMKLKRDFMGLAKVFIECLNQNYILTCCNIIEANKNNEPVVKSLQALLDRKLEDEDIYSQMINM